MKVPPRRSVSDDDVVVVSDQSLPRICGRSRSVITGQANSFAKNARVVPVTLLENQQQYAFFRFFPNNGGFRIVTATGSQLRQSWSACVRDATNGGIPFEKFRAAVFRRPSERMRATQSFGRGWMEVILPKKKGFSFYVQKVNQGSI